MASRCRPCGICLVLHVEEGLGDDLLLDLHRCARLEARDCIAQLSGVLTTVDADARDRDGGLDVAGEGCLRDIRVGDVRDGGKRLCHAAPERRAGVPQP